MTTRRSRIDCSLVIPVYNGQSFIESTTKAYAEAFSQSPLIHSFEIILVTNNCSDGSPALCASMTKKHAHVKHLDYPYKTLKGGAVIRGFQHARFPFVGFTDIDMSTAPEEFLKLIPPMSDSMVGACIASRKMHDSILHPPQSFLRQFLGNSFGVLRELLFGLGIRDSQCGAKLFKKNAIFPLELTSNGWAFDVELLYRVKQHGLRIREVGVTWRDQPGSTISFSTPFTMFLELVRLRLRV
jgi:glycosyltransferase involved in cell wall biosynthesis